MKIDWNQLSPAELEQLCFFLLEKSGFFALQWHGKGGGDKGRDLTAKKKDNPLGHIERVQEWVVQCKRYTSSPPSKAELNDFLTAAKEHQPDNVLIIITNTLSSGTKDWLDAVKHQYPFGVYVWEELDLRKQTLEHWREVAELVPSLRPSGKTIVIYEMATGEYTFGSDEHQEVELIAVNCATREDAVAKVREFVTALRTNEIEIV